ncbi:tetraspanin-9-like isoform X2 [Mytilus californianus]|uniref:tetraspanin-9-like isoform X2 n=1 Tax=Mytilus californianus TaxID=6549 RepID=UPI002247C618|nr:tetraspanin-9-like isoform X2 [Mytilus californianus]
MCSPKCATIILIGINVIFFLLGLGIIIPGILLLVDNEAINDKIIPLFKELSLGSTNFGDLAKNLPIALISLGSLVLVISVIGLLGTCCCKIRCFLMVYAIIVIILLIGKVVVLALWYFMNDKFTTTIKDEMLKNLKAKYTNDDLTSNEISTSWNQLQLAFECCAINAVTSATNDFDNTTWQTGSPPPSTDIPISCCPGVTSSNYTAAAATNPLCPSLTTVAPSGQYSKGCYDAIYDFIKGYSLWFYIGGPILFLIEISGIVCAFYLFCKNDKEDD